MPCQEARALGQSLAQMGRAMMAILCPWVPEDTEDELMVEIHDHEGLIAMGQVDTADLYQVVATFRIARLMHNAC